jgi:hypothetical protein
MEKNMLKRLFKHLLKKYSKNEKDRIEVMEELWNGILSTYTEQTYPGNIQNMQIEMIMSNPWIRFAVSSYDSNSVNFIKMNLEGGILSAIEFLESENSEITKDGFEALIKFHSIRTK